MNGLLIDTFDEYVIKKCPSIPEVPYKDGDSSSLISDRDVSLLIVECK